MAGISGGMGVGQQKNMLGSLIFIGLLIPIATYATSPDFDSFKSCDRDSDCVTMYRKCHGWESVNKEKRQDAERYNRLEVQALKCVDKYSDKPDSACRNGKCEIVNENGAGKQ